MDPRKGKQPTSNRPIAPQDNWARYRSCDRAADKVSNIRHAKFYRWVEAFWIAAVIAGVALAVVVAELIIRGSHPFW